MKHLSFLLLLSVCFASSGGLAQTPSDEPSRTSTGIAGQPRLANPKSAPSSKPVGFGDLPRNMLYDQKRFWSSPSRLRVSDLNWLVPATAVLSTTFAVDQAIERQLPSDQNLIGRASSLSNYGVAGFSLATGGLYLWGRHTNNDHLREAGFLGGEAALNSFLITTSVKAATSRQRPEDGGGRGDFFANKSAIGSSFPSQHSAVAWSIATVLANEYPGWMTKVLAYGGASAVGVARIVGQKHFASDVLVGSALGYMVGRQVYVAHSKEIGNFGSFENPRNTRRDPAMMGSPYVPLDSWIYEAFDRLNALGLTPNAFQNLRPWTRLECARLLEDIDEEQIGSDHIRSILLSLRQEFAHEQNLLMGDQNLRVRLGSLYTRLGASSEQPLSDGLHFGQSTINDYGRPLGKGFNQVSGFIAEAEAGPLTFHVQAEYQRAGSVEPYPLEARSLIAGQDNLPILPARSNEATQRMRLLDSYVGLNVHSWNLSFGKQSMWWGPSRGGDLMLSTNAEPMTAFKISRVTPLRLPGVLGVLGPFRSDIFLGQLEGYRFLRLGPDFDLTGSWNSVINPKPFVWGGKVALKPTENLELGFSMTTVFAGLGRPMTLDTFKHTFSGSGNAQLVEPGDRRTGFDFSYRVPRLRRWLTIYNGSLAEDEPNPIAYPRRSAMNPGIYLVRIPGLEKLDFRAEAVYTNLPNLVYTGFFYTNTHYAGGYTNNGNIIGSWIGPEAHGLQLWTNYWFASNSSLRLGYRNQKIDPEFLKGGKLEDVSVQYKLRSIKNVDLTSEFQYERRHYPALSGWPKSNVLFAIQMQWYPKLNWSPRSSTR